VSKSWCVYNSIGYVHLSLQYCYLQPLLYKALWCFCVVCYRLLSSKPTLHQRYESLWPNAYRYWCVKIVSVDSDRTPWKGDRSIARPARIRDNTKTEKGRHSGIQTDDTNVRIQRNVSRILIARSPWWGFWVTTKYEVATQSRLLLLRPLVAINMCISHNL
jgi:hypothetical protein